MISTTTPELYCETLTRLCDAIGVRAYFSGSVCFTLDDVDYRLTTSVIVYHRKEDAPEGVSHSIRDLVPVWWEFHSIIAGVESLNDFSFSELKTYL